MNKVPTEQPRLISERLELHALGPTFFSEAYLGWLNDSEVNRYSYRRHRTTTAKELASFLADLSSRVNERHFAIVHQAEGAHIGNIALNGIHWGSRFAELGLLLGSGQHQNQGYATESIRLMLFYGFEYLNLHRIEIGSYNPAAIRAFEKAGFVHEGVSRKKLMIDGVFYDDIRMAILADEYFAKKDS